MMLYEVPAILVQFLVLLAYEISVPTELYIVQSSGDIPNELMYSVYGPIGNRNHHDDVLHHIYWVSQIYWYYDSIQGVPVKMPSQPSVVMSNWIWLVESHFFPSPKSE
jgi:hypothetical protein